MHRVTHTGMNETCHTHQWAKAWIWMRHVAGKNESYHAYGVATISRLLKIRGRFCRIQSLLEGSFAKETYNSEEPTHRSHPIESVMSRLWTRHVRISDVAHLHVKRNTLHTAPRCNTLQHADLWVSDVAHLHVKRNTLHTTPRCSTLQQTATHWCMNDCYSTPACKKRHVVETLGNTQHRRIETHHATQLWGGYDE